jgi:hypothetical protein
VVPVAAARTGPAASLLKSRLRSRWGIAGSSRATLRNVTRAGVPGGALGGRVRVGVGGAVGVGEPAGVGVGVGRGVGEGVGERLGVGVGVGRGDAVGEAAMAVGDGDASGGRVRKTPTK